MIDGIWLVTFEGILFRCLLWAAVVVAFGVLLSTGGES